MLIDHGSDVVLINPSLTDSMKLKYHKLLELKEVCMAVGNGKETFIFKHWDPITIISTDQTWTLHICCAIIAPNLCIPILLGGPFLFSNSLVIDHETHTCIDKKTRYNLFNPMPIEWSITKAAPRFGPKLKKLQKSFISDIESLFPTTHLALDKSAATSMVCPVAAVRIILSRLFLRNASNRTGRS